MTRIDFYLLEENNKDGKEMLACKLVQKAFQLGHQVYLLTCDTAQSRHLDQMLWTFGPDSFVPHALADSNDATLPPVIIGHQTPAPSQHDVLLSLTGDIPAFFSQFSRMIEVIGQPGEERQAARERFRFYRERGYPLHTHHL